MSPSSACRRRRRASSARSAPDWRPPVLRPRARPTRRGTAARARLHASPARTATSPSSPTAASRTRVESPDRARCAEDDGAARRAPASGLRPRGSDRADHGRPRLRARRRPARVRAQRGRRSPVQPAAASTRRTRRERRGHRRPAPARRPALAGSSRVEHVTIDGRTSIRARPSEAGRATCRRREVVKVKFNEQTRAGTTLQRSARCTSSLRIRHGQVDPRTGGRRGQGRRRQRGLRPRRQEARGGERAATAKPTAVYRGAEYDAVHEPLRHHTRARRQLATAASASRSSATRFERPHGAAA